MYSWLSLTSQSATFCVFCWNIFSLLEFYILIGGGKNSVFFLCLFTTIPTSPPLFTPLISIYALIALSILLFPPFFWIDWTGTYTCSRSSSNIALSKQNSWFSTTSPFSPSFPILKWLHYLLSLLGPKPRDQPLLFSVITTSDPLAIPFDSSFTLYTDNKHIWKLLLSWSSHYLTLIVAVDFYPLLSYLLPITNFTH